MAAQENSQDGDITSETTTLMKTATSSYVPETSETSETTIGNIIFKDNHGQQNQVILTLNNQSKHMILPNKYSSTNNTGNNYNVFRTDSNELEHNTTLSTATTSSRLSGGNNHSVISNGQQQQRQQQAQHEQYDSDSDWMPSSQSRGMSTEEHNEGENEVEGEIQYHRSKLLQQQQPPRNINNGDEEEEWQVVSIDSKKTARVTGTIASPLVSAKITKGYGSNNHSSTNKNNNHSYSNSTQDPIIKSKMINNNNENSNNIRSRSRRCMPASIMILGEAPVTQS